MATKAISKKKLAVKKAAPKKVKIIPVKSKHIISKDKGEVMKAAYMKQIKAVKTTGNIKFNNGREFDKSLFEQLLSIKGVKKIRVYNALNENNEHTFVITAVNNQGFNLFLPMPITVSSAKTTSSAEGSSGVGNMGDQCTDPKYKP